MDIAGDIAYFTALRNKASHAAPPAVMAMARTYQRYVQRELSGASPSAPGSPPGLRSGRLRSSVTTAGPSGGGIVAFASVAPHTIYAHIQEYGGTIHPERVRALHWGPYGGGVFAMHAHLPERAYMRPATAATVANGSLHRAAAAAFAATVWG